uniref:hypothetical protein n=1 Tax=Cellvibrio fontiphilus TaxID=1815559 RepID=UPI002B4BDA1C|nr:hypothetical protein [Cellvibrio fontiphilus]
MERKGNRTTERESIKSFFDWLVPNIDRIFSDFNFQEEISKKLSVINPNIRWEAGPWESGENFFAVSPNLDVNNFSLTKLLTECAPNVVGWFFLSSKPRKRWSSRVIKIKSGNKFIEYNIDSWRYYLTSFNDGEFFDVNLIPYGHEDIPIDDLEYIGSMFVEFELGEEIYMELIDQINIVLPSNLEVSVNKPEFLYPQILEERLTIDE